MAKQAVLEITDGKMEEALRGLLKRLLEKKVVDAILIPKAAPPGNSYVQSLIRDPEKLSGTSVLAPTMPVQSARVVSHLTFKGLGQKVLAVLKPCEVRAVVELVKFLQVKQENLYLMSVDCPGTFEVLDYAKMSEEAVGGEGLERILREGMENGEINPPAGYHFRTACQMCEYPVVEADIYLKLFGYKADEKIGIEVGDRLHGEIEEKGILSFSAEEPAKRSEVVNKVIAARTKKRDEAFAEFKEVTKDLRSFLDRFSTCVRCHNCMVACPICYCKECVFRTSVFEHEGDQFLRWADRKGAIRMPTDTLMFHLIRLSHMVTSCIGCGLCESACPSRLPVATLFRSVGEKVQKMFQYVPGRKVDEAPPVATFREDELKLESGAL
jgi:formate dehydrogenase subunit beta